MAVSRTARKTDSPPSELEQIIRRCRIGFATVAVFSAVINILMLTQPLYMLQVYSRVLTTGHYETLIALTVIAAVAIATLCVLDGLRSSVTIRIGAWFNDRMGPLLIASSVRAELAGRGFGAQPIRDLAQIQNFISTQGLSVFFDLPWVPLYLLLIWMLHPLLGATATASAITLLALGVLNELATRTANDSASARQIEAAQQADRTVRNAEAVTAMAMLPAMITRWYRAHRLALAASRRAGETGALLIAATKFVRLFVQIAMLGLGAMLVIRGALTPGAMIAGSILLGRALAPVEVAITAWRNFSGSRIAYRRLEALLSRYPPIEPRMPLPAPTGRVTVERLTHVAESGATILRGVSFSVEPGEMVAVIGPSGAGKSSLCRLLVGLYEPAAGRVRIDGSEIGHWDRLQIGQHVGYLPQDVELFAGTVRENIARMDIGESAGVVEAAMLAQAHDLIQKLSDGYETEIGDHGLRLSGGQRQRIGLARAIYGNPRVLVLDEPNSSLDQAGEAGLVAALGEIKERGTAIVVVGHRPSTLAQADKILLLRDGRVEIFGPRDEVMKRMREASVAAARKSPAVRDTQPDESGADEKRVAAG
ncbi:MAG: type I secretion system permease/ATPase [Hyphomicrobiaceae bacterium]